MKYVLAGCLLLVGCQGFWADDYYQDAVTLTVKGTDCDVVLKSDEIRGGPGVSAKQPKPLHRKDSQ